MKKYLYPIAIISVITLSNCSSKENENIPNQEQAIKVKTSKVSANHQENTFATSGKLVAKNSVNLSTRVMGHIVKMNAEVGQNVKAGQILVNINNTDIQAKEGQINAQISQAQANYNLAKKDYERFLNLYQSESASQKELDDMKARYEMAKAGLQASQQMKREVNAQYRYTQITAPIPGTITAKYAEQGDLANPGMPILTIESPSQLQAQILVPEQYITQIAQNMSVDIILKSNKEKISGIVNEISQSSTHSGGQYLVKVNIPNQENLRSGMFINAYFPIKNTKKEHSQNTIIIPKSALVERGQLVGIYTISQENTAVLRWVKTGKEFDNQIEILSGLSANETYITSAEGKLYNGAKIDNR